MSDYNVERYGQKMIYFLIRLIPVYLQGVHYETYYDYRRSAGELREGKRRYQFTLEIRSLEWRKGEGR